MKLDQIDQEKSKGMSVQVAVLLASVLILLLLVVMLVLNRDRLTGRKTSAKQISEEVQDVDEQYDPEDVWAGVIAEPDREEEELPEENMENDGAVSVDPDYESTHTRVVKRDGTEEWLMISKYMPPNPIDPDRLREDGKYLNYEDEEMCCFTGILVDKQQGIIDYNKVKKAGIDFVMIRLGQRGYQTGTLSLDEHFAQNMQGAGNAGLKIGILFATQAVTEEEAVEEAEYVLSYLEDYAITYPVALYAGYVGEEEARADGLSKFARTKIISAFLDKIKDAGYVPMIAADKLWLLKNLELSVANDYDVWFLGEGDYPDYPYKLSMWQYSTSTGVNGVVGTARISMSLVDYTKK